VVDCDAFNSDDDWRIAYFYFCDDSILPPNRDGGYDLIDMFEEVLESIEQSTAHLDTPVHFIDVMDSEGFDLYYRYIKSDPNDPNDLNHNDFVYRYKPMKFAAHGKSGMTQGGDPIGPVLYDAIGPSLYTDIFNGSPAELMDDLLYNHPISGVCSVSEDITRLYYIPPIKAALFRLVAGGLGLQPELQRNDRDLYFRQGLGLTYREIPGLVVPMRQPLFPAKKPGPSIVSYGAYPYTFEWSPTNTIGVSYANATPRADPLSVMIIHDMTDFSVNPSFGSMVPGSLYYYDDVSTNVYRLYFKTELSQGDVLSIRFLYRGSVYQDW
jgi:hypothetical protein